MDELVGYLMLALTYDWHECATTDQDSWMNNVLLRATAIALQQPIVLMLADSNPCRFFVFAHTKYSSKLNSTFNEHLGSIAPYSISETTEVLCPDRKRVIDENAIILFKCSVARVQAVGKLCKRKPQCDHAIYIGANAWWRDKRDGPFLYFHSGIQYALSRMCSYQHAATTKIYIYIHQPYILLTCFIAIMCAEYSTCRQCNC